MVNTNIPFYHRTNEDFLTIGNEISPSTSLRTGYEANGSCEYRNTWTKR